MDHEDAQSEFLEPTFSPSPSLAQRLRVNDRCAKTAI